MNNKITKILKQTYSYFLIALFSVIPFWNTGTKGLMERTDADFPLVPISNLHSQLYVWYDKVTMGYDVSSAFLSQLPFYSLLAILSKIGLPLPIIERLWFFLGLFLAGVFSFHLNHYLTKNRLTSMFGSLFYIFNPVIMHLLSQGEHVLIMCYAFAPIFLLLSIKAFDTKQLKFAFYIALLSIFAAITSVPTLVINFLPCMLYIFFSAFKKENRLFALKFFSSLLSLLFIFNAWWFIPGVLSLSGNAQIEDINRMWLINWKTISASASYFYALIAAGVPRAILGSVLSLALIVCTIITVTLVFFFSKRTSENHRKISFFLLLLLFSLLFAVGDKGIWGDAQQFMMMKISQLQMFRNPYKFAQITMLCYTVMTSLSLSYLINLTKKNNFKAIILAFYVFLLLFANKPILSGNLEGFLEPVSIPNEYYDLNEYIKNNSTTEGILILPQEEWLSKYSWTTYDMPDFSRYLLENPIIRDYPENRLASLKSVYLMASTYDLINNSLDTNLSQYLYLMNAKYILAHKDVEKYTRDIVPYEKIQKSLSMQPDIKLVLSNQYFDLYENTLSSQTIYASNNIIIDDYSINPNLADNTKNISELLNKADFFSKPVFSLENTQANLRGIETGSSLPDITTEKISPVEYKVTIKNAAQPYVLAFLQSYNTKWQASINGNPVDNKNHFVANNYANGWTIDKTGDYTIRIYYTPQLVFRRVAIADIFIIIISIIYLIYIEKNGKAKKT